DLRPLLAGHRPSRSPSRGPGGAARRDRLRLSRDLETRGRREAWRTAMSDEPKVPTDGHGTVGSTEPDVQRPARLAGLRPPWRPGQSGNRGCRSKKRPITEAMEKLAAEPVPQEVLQRLRLPGLAVDAKVTWADVIVRGIAISAAKGRAESCSIFADRLEGKVA